jgi:hypothetical protein
MDFGFVVTRMRVETIGRRTFIAASAGAAFASRLAWATGETSSLLDHLLLGCDNLDRGVDFVEKHTGIRAAIGGVHPGRGTHNALLSLGERRYLEVIAPDPKQDENHVEKLALKQLARLKELTSPRLVGWAVHPGDLERFSVRLRDAGIGFLGPWAGSRQRPDGKLLQWKSLNLKDDRDGLLPFFIEWSAGSLHPSADAPKGCRLERFAAVTPNPQELEKLTAILQIGLPISSGETPALQATIVGSQGKLSATS